MPPKHSPTRYTRQAGATLVITMVFLTLLMMLAGAAMVASHTQFKLSGNIQFEDAALNRAEAAIAAAESWLASGNKDPGFANFSAATPHLHPIAHLAGMAAPNNSALTMAWNDGNSLAVSPGDDSQRYFIEQVSQNVRLAGASVVLGDRASSACNRVNTYLITARGSSQRGAVKLIQSYYGVPSCPAPGGQL